MKIFKNFEKLIRSIFPSTFTIAILLSIITFILALYLTDPVNIQSSSNLSHKELLNDPLSNSDIHIFQIFGFWYKGLWNTSLLAFAIQMMLILVLGYVLASTRVIKSLIEQILKYCTTTSRAALLVGLFTMLVSLFNWGLGLIFGAILARKVGEYAKTNNIRLNYPLIVAAGYSGLMIWHGGLSGSAPLKAAEKGHFLALTGKDIPAVDFSQTIFSGMNILITIIILIIIPATLFLLGRNYKGSTDLKLSGQKEKKAIEIKDISGLEKLDYTRWISLFLGLTFLFIALYKAILTGDLSVIDPNYLNFILLGLGLTFCNNIADFLVSVKNAMGSAAGILIQFPLYFGIMGIMKYSGLVEIFSGFLMNISNETTFPIFTFFSAGLVNIFVPSGGGQWAVQGPIIIEASQNLGIPLGKAIMALAYGDQITNMLQPFWALPLLGITGLKAKDIIPFTIILMLVGTLIFISGLLLF